MTGGFQLSGRISNARHDFGDGTLGQMMEPVLFREEELIVESTKEWALTVTKDASQLDSVNLY